MQLTVYISVWVLRVLILAVQGTILSIMTLLAANVAGIRSQFAHSQVLLSTLCAHWIVIIVTLVPSVVPLLRVVPLLALAGNIPFSFVPLGLFGNLGQITGLALWVYFLIMSWL